MSDLSIGRIFRSNWLDLLRVVGWVRPAYIEILIEIRIIILAGFFVFIKKPFETASRNGPLLLPISGWPTDCLGGFTKVGRAKGEFAIPP